MENEEIVVSFDGIKMKDFRAYWVAVARNDWVEQDKFFARIVRSWPYPLDPKEALSYQELELDHYMRVQGAIRLASGEISRKISQGSISGLNNAHHFASEVNQ